MDATSLLLVSIGIPAYKSRYLARAIDSVLTQTYRNIEVIIVNDCSPQNVSEVVAKYSDERIRYFVNEKNVGANDPGNNWNICLKYAQGTFFSLLCDDDIYEPTFVEEMILLSEKYPGCNVFHSGVKVVNLQNKIIQQFPHFPQWESCADYIKKRSLGLRKQTISEWMFRRTHIVTTGGYVNLPLAWGADYLSIMKFAVKGGIASTNKALVTFRRSDENITMTFVGNCEKKMQALFLYQTELKRMINENEELSSKNLLTCADRIRKLENMAILVGANHSEYKRIIANYNKYGLKVSEIILSIIKRIIKKVAAYMIYLNFLFSIFFIPLIAIQVSINDLKLLGGRYNYKWRISNWISIICVCLFLAAFVIDCQINGWNTIAYALAGGIISIAWIWLMSKWNVKSLAVGYLLIWLPLVIGYCTFSLYDIITFIPFALYGFYYRNCPFGNLFGKMLLLLQNKSLENLSLKKISCDRQEHIETNMPHVPDFSFAGCLFTDVPKHEMRVYDVTDEGILPNTGEDVTRKVQLLIDKVGQQNGGRIYFPKGRYLFNNANQELAS